MFSLHRVIVPYLTIIQNRRYFPLWIGQLVSSLGDTLNYIALVIYVYQLTGSGFDLAKLSMNSFRLLLGEQTLRFAPG